MTNKKRITLIVICSILMVATVASMGFLMFKACESKKANADYVNDILNNPNAIVNFNQLYRYRLDDMSVGGLTFTNSQIINGTYVSNGYTKVSESFSVISGHRYFVRYNYNNTFYFTFNTALPDNGRLIQSQIVQAVANSNDVYFVWHSEENTVFDNYKLNLIIVDLDSMFGSDNIPSLEQCNNLFIANSYPYNTGTPLSLSGINAYEQGYLDAMGSYDITYNGYLLQSNIFMLNGELFPISQSGERWLGTSPDSNGINCFGFKIPFTTNTNDVISLSFRTIALARPFIDGGGVSGNLFEPILYVGYYNNGAFVSLATIDATNSTWNGSGYLNEGTWEELLKNGSLSFKVPNIDALYFRSTSNEYISTFDLSIKVESTNLSAITQESFNQGYSKAKEYFENQYSVGGDAYMKIYNNGVRDAESGASVFQDSWAFMGSVFSGFGDLLTVEFFPGLPIGIFVALPLLLGLIYFIVKLSKGGG